MAELLGITDHRPLVAVAPVLGLAVYCFTHIVAARIIRGRSPYPALAVGALTGLLATIGITVAACRWDAVSPIDTLALVVLNAIASLAFAFGYFEDRIGHRPALAYTLVGWMVLGTPQGVKTLSF